MHNKLYVQVHYILYFFFNDTAPTEIYTLSLHDALPICQTFDALITGICDETENLGFSLYEGRILGQAPEIDGRLLVNDGIDLLPESLPAFARIEITDAHPYDLVGAVVA